jgi:hypothetical protein
MVNSGLGIIFVIIEMENLEEEIEKLERELETTARTLVSEWHVRDYAHMEEMVAKGAQLSRDIEELRTQKELREMGDRKYYTATILALFKDKTMVDSHFVHASYMKYKGTSFVNNPDKFSIPDDRLWGKIVSLHCDSQQYRRSSLLHKARKPSPSKTKSALGPGRQANGGGEEQEQEVKECTKMLDDVHLF